MPPGLIRRGGGRYSIRRRIPLDLVAHYGRAELVRALGTSDPKQARKLHALEWVKLDAEFEAARMSATSGSKLKKAEPSPPAHVFEAMLSPVVSTMSDAEFEYEMEKAAWEEEFFAELDAEDERLEGVLERIRPPEDVPTRLLNDEQRAIRKLMREHEEELAVLRNRVASHELTAPKARSEAPPPVSPISGGQAVAEPATETTLHQVVDRWARERKPAEKTIDAHRAVVRWFVDRVRIERVDQITRKEVLAFKDQLLSEGQKVSNVQVKLTRLRTILGYAHANALIDTNPASEVRLIDPDAAKSRRKPFDVAALAALFGSPIFVTGERPVQGRGDAAYWLPILGLFTGARLEELGQLRTADIREAESFDPDGEPHPIWVINIAEDAEAGLKLKNAGSARIVPIHPVLVDLGFLDYVQEVRAAKHARLFPDLRPDKYGRLTAKWGEWFSRYKREVCGITDRSMVFHSLRHTFKDYAREAGIPEGIQRQLMGHSGRDTADSYGSGFSLRRLSEAIETYRVPAFKLSAGPASKAQE